MAPEQVEHAVGRQMPAEQAALVFLGVALMLWGAVSSSDMEHPWLLIVVPLVPFVIAGLAAWRAQSTPDHSVLDKVKEQLDADMAMLREAGAA